MKEQALIEAMDRCGGYVFSLLKGWCGEEQLAEDLLQKLWVYVFDKFEVEHFTHVGFLKRKAYQLYIDEMRRKDSRPVLDRYEELPDSPEWDQFREPANNEEELRLYEEFWGQFASLSLSDLDKSLLWYHARFGYTMIEISEKFQIPKSTVNDRIRETRQKCMNHLENPYQD